MRKLLFVLSLILVLVSCNKTSVTNDVLVDSNKKLYEALKKAKAGDNIVLKNGVWKDVKIKFRGKGTEKAPITIKAETAGKVSIEGESYLKFGGEYLVVEGLHFKNGYSPSSAVIEFRIRSKNKPIEIANHCKVTNCVIEDFNKPQRDNKDLWVNFHGRHNELSNSYLAGKTNKGPTVRIDLEGIESINNYHKIINNHFGPRPIKGGPSGETIQLGNSYTSMAPSYTLVANNLFEECNGEVEIISSKTNFNEFRNNVFYKSEGSLVTRHGNYCTIDGNYFIGDGVNEQFGGIRIINTGHWVTNNYFYNLKGSSFRSPLAVMNGIPKSPQNRYGQVTDVVVAYNTYVNCTSPWRFGVGVNIDQKDVLPKSEIRSERAIRSTVANNVIYNEKGLAQIVNEDDKADGVLFKNNIVDNQGVAFKDFDGGIKAAELSLTKLSDNVSIPTGVPFDIEAYQGFDFNTITKDLFGKSRKDTKTIGATVGVDFSNPNILDKSKYGTSWYSNVVEPREAVVHKVSKIEDLQAKLDGAQNGDIIEIASGVYNVGKSIVINKTITVKSEGEKAQLVFSGDAATPLFSLQPKGKLTVSNLNIKGNGSNYAFASLKEGMSNHFGLTVSNLEISDFDYVLKAYKESFSERITFKGTKIANCENGLELSEETNNKGDYNTEYLTIDNCEFSNVKQNVIDYYRGGYDESTIGGNLLVSNSTFTNCASKEKNGLLFNHRGIVYVNITKNKFVNNAVKNVAILWGAKHNYESENTYSNSSKIITQQNIKQETFY